MIKLGFAVYRDISKVPLYDTKEFVWHLMSYTQYALTI